MRYTDPSGHCPDDPAHPEYEECWAYLNNGDFCDGIDCGELGWRRWLIVNSDSIWSLSELKRIKTALLIVKGALTGHGFDWLEVVGDKFIFERFNMERVPESFDREISIYDDDGKLLDDTFQLSYRQLTGQIGLSDEAFSIHGIGSLFHEIGHAIDDFHNRVPQDTFGADRNYDSLAYTLGGSIRGKNERWAEAFEGFVSNYGRPERDWIRPERGYSVNWDVLHYTVFRALKVAVEK